MLTEAMEQFGLTRSLRQVGYFATDHHEQLLRELKAAIQDGGLVAVTGVVGSGKTLLLGGVSPNRRKFRHNKFFSFRWVTMPIFRYRNHVTSPVGC